MIKFIKGLAVAAMLCAPVFAMAQQMQMPPAPVDSAVRVGKLENGLTYYIRHNEQPKGQADFFIAQKVGSILEEENQRGLAHFLEHMCFNGTQNFPGNSLIDWLGTVGVKFGQNLNAYTAIDETVYNISAVPVQRTGVQDSCLLILHDWADGLLLDPEEIDKERGVIHQEWRSRNVGQMRLYEQLLPVMYAGNKYGHRLPIGTMEVVDNFPHQALRDYYEAWYRPDQQGIIVVGDIDPDYIEAKIKEIFSPIQMPADAKKREYLEIEDTPGTIFAIGTDKEMPMSQAYIMFKQKEKMLPDNMKGTMAYFPVEFVKSMVSMMLNERLSDLSQKPDAPYAGARVDLGDFFISPTKDALTLVVTGKGNDIRPAMQTVYRELLRAARGGFTTAEYDRAKTKLISALEKRYEQRDGITNSAYAREYAANFTKDDPIPGIGFELTINKQIADAMPLEAINQVLPGLIGEDNRVIALFLPEKEGVVVPTEAELAQLMQGVEAEDIEVFKEDLKTEPLIETLPAPVQPQVVENTQWQATELIYPNGAHVIVKPTDFKGGEIVFEAIAKGGLASMDVDPATATSLHYLAGANGYGTYSRTDMQKYLNGKKTSLSQSVDDYYRTIAGSTTPQNVKTLMELLYMTFAGYQITEDDFASMQARLASIVENQEKTPDFAFQRQMLKSLYKSPAKQLFSSEGFKNAGREETLAVMQNMYSNPADFTFVFVGDLNVDSIKAMADQYIGTLRAPRIAGVPFVQNPAFEMTTGAATQIETMAMETPQTYALVSLSANVPYTAKNRALSRIAPQVLTKRLLNKIREEMGAVYSIGAQGDLDRLAGQNAYMLIPFPMKPELKDQVLAEVASMVNGMATDVTADELAPVVEFMVKQAKENKEDNDAWANAITGTQLNGVDAFNGDIQVLESITADDVKNYVKALLDANNYRVFVLDPEAK